MENKTTNSYPETGICSLCGGVYDHYGNNPMPLIDDFDARCCDRCNEEKVVPARCRIMDHLKDLQEEWEEEAREDFKDHLKDLQEEWEEEAREDSM